MSIPKPIILDISEWQVPSQINYDQWAKTVAGVIIRVQYGSNKIDKHYVTHIKECQKRQIPIAVYAWVRGISISDMQQEARDFWQRAQKFQPTFWWLDVEEFSMKDMRGGCEAYRQELKRLGAKNVGVYIANHLYHQLNLETAKFERIWLPTYGKNSGRYEGANPTASSQYDLHQYTSRGRIAGYRGDLDLNRVHKTTVAALFVQKTTSSSTEKPNTEGGITMKTVILDTAVHLRKSPNTQSASIALLKKGAVIKFNNIKVAQGYLWAEQIRNDQSKAYLALGNFTGFGSIS
ncbi:MAG: glycoside hydrolase family 25 protein [Enterococcus sp.]